MHPNVRIADVFLRTGDRLDLELTGRFDTLSAPDVLDLFQKEKAKQEIHRAVIDCSRLSYISSAGLRVLLIMKKACRDGITLTGVNDMVMDTIEKTGFTVL